jgi:hypothetical protein
VLGLFLAAAGTCDGVDAPDSCIQDRTYIVGSKADETMAAGDCDVGGNPTDLFKLSVATKTTLKFIVTSTGDANPTFSITDDGKAAPENIVVERNGRGKVVTVYAMLLPGNYTLGVSAGDGPEEGAYMIQSQVVSPPPAGCVTVLTTTTTTYLWAMRGVEAAGAITNDDCVGNGFVFDAYFLYMVAGKNYKITIVSSGTGGVNVELNNNGTILAHQNTANNGPGTLTFNYPATQSMAVGINIIGIPAGGRPTYTIKIE